MITHYIIISSSYSKGKRIALDYILDEKSDYEMLKKIINKIIDECGKDVSVSTHFVQTDSKSWKSVVEKDYFFKNVEVIKNINDFIALIKIDRELTGIDVAKYILSRVKCTHLKLEKLVYMCFSEYLCRKNKILYTDKIYAYKYGPVVKSVYDKYKQYGYKEIEKDTVNINASDVYELPAKSRILFAEDGIEKLKIIEDIIEKYGILSAEKLVELTHRKNTPWDMSGRGEFENKVITNEIIKKYHCNEKIWDN